MKRRQSPAVQAAAPEVGPSRDPSPAHQALWFALAKKRLVSVALVPTAEGRAAADLAAALVEIGQRLGDSPITAVVADVMDYAFVSRTAEVVAMTGGGEKRPSASPLEVIIAIRPVTTDPLGLAVVQAADAAVICVELGRSKLSDVRRTIALIGRERIAGSVTIG